MVPGLLGAIAHEPLPSIRRGKRREQGFHYGAVRWSFQPARHAHHGSIDRPFQPWAVVLRTAD